MLRKKLAWAWHVHRLYVLLALSIVIFLTVYLLVPAPQDSLLTLGGSDRPTATPLPGALPGLLRLTDDPGEDKYPAWSPDGNLIAFSRHRRTTRRLENGASSTNVYRGLQVMQADGSGAQELVKLPQVAADVSWSPDGTRLAFLSYGDIYIIGADGEQLEQLTDIEDAIVDAPTWSPDGRSVAFISDPDGAPDLYTVSDGRLQRLTDNHAWTGYPAWSPDGRSIAFHSTRDGHIAIYTLDVACAAQREPDPACQTRLTDPATENREPAWSPDGGRIVFTSLRDGNLEIYVMNADGSQQTRLTNSPSVDWLPAWSPDGARVAFLSSPDLQSVHNDVYTLRPGGDDLRRLTNDGLVSAFAWSPDGRYIAFTSHRDSQRPHGCSPCNVEIYRVSVEGD